MDEDERVGGVMGATKTLLSLWERKGPAAKQWEGEGAVPAVILTLPQLRCSLPLLKGEGM